MGIVSYMSNVSDQDNIEYVPDGGDKHSSIS